DYLTGGVGFEWDFAPMLSLQGEIFMQEGRSRSFIPASVTQPRPQLGLRVTPVSTVDMDFIYGHNVNGQSAHWWTLGFTVRSQGWWAAGAVDRRRARVRRTQAHLLEVILRCRHLLRRLHRRRL